MRENGRRHTFPSCGFYSPPAPNMAWKMGRSPRSSEDTNKFRKLFEVSWHIHNFSRVCCIPEKSAREDFMSVLFGVTCAKVSKESLQAPIVRQIAETISTCTRRYIFWWPRPHRRGTIQRSGEIHEHIEKRLGVEVAECGVEGVQVGTEGRVLYQTPTQAGAPPPCKQAVTTF